MNSRIVFISVILMAVGITLFSFKPEQKSPPDGEDKDVTLVVSGQGRTIDEARQNALRSAIEQTFGTFISSNTTILNDSLVKDEIVSVSSGNIKNYETISEVQIPDGGYASTLRATVSVSKLTSFCESKGVTVEFKGATFAMNIKLQKLNEDAEYNAVLNLCRVSKEILSKSIDYNLTVSEPTSYQGSNDLFKVNFIIDCKSNENLNTFYTYFWTTLEKVGMSHSDIQNYKSLQKNISNVIQYRVYDGQMANAPDIILDTIFLRNPKSLLALKNLYIKSNDNLLNFRITSEVDTLSVRKVRDTDFQANNFCTSGCMFEYYTKPNFWQLDFGSGFPSAHKGPPYYTSTGGMYGEVLEEMENKKLWFDSVAYFTTSFGVYQEGCYISDYCEWKRWLQLPGELYTPDNLGLYIHNKTTFSTQFKYMHLSSLEKLEKTSGYKIEYWLNEFENITPKDKGNGKTK